MLCKTSDDEHFYTSASPTPQSRCACTALAMRRAAGRFVQNRSRFATFYSHCVHTSHSQSPCTGTRTMVDLLYVHSRQHICTFIHVHRHAHMHIRTLYQHKHARTHAHAQAYIYTCKHRHTYVRTQMNWHALFRMFDLHRHKQRIVHAHTYAHAYTHARTRTRTRINH